MDEQKKPKFFIPKRLTPLQPAETEAHSRLEKKQDERRSNFFVALCFLIFHGYQGQKLWAQQLRSNSMRACPGSLPLCARPMVNCKTSQDTKYYSHSIQILPWRGKSKLHGMLPATQSGVLCLQAPTLTASLRCFRQIMCGACLFPYPATIGTYWYDMCLL